MTVTSHEAFSLAINCSSSGLFMTGLGEEKRDLFSGLMKSGTTHCAVKTLTVIDGVSVKNGT